MDAAPRTLPGLRFTCRGCADCCSSGFDLGPVEPEVITFLTENAIETRWPAAAAAPWATRRPGPDGRPEVYLRQIDGRCVFLRDDNLCAVHHLFGADRKPAFCREFPYHLVEDPRGWVAVTRPSCGGLHRSYADGDPVSDAELSAVRDLPRAAPRRRFAPNAVEALPGVRVPLAEWMRWEDQLLAALDAAPDLTADAALVTVRDALATLAGVELPPAVPGVARHAAAAILTALERVMAAVLAQSAGAPPDRVRFAHEAAERLPRARERLISAPPLDADTHRYLHTLLRAQLLAKQWEAWGSVHAGLGQHQLGVWVGRALADASGPDAFAAPYTHWLRLSANRMIQQVLRSAHTASTDLFLHTL